VYGVVSLLDDRHTALVESLWAELERELGLRGVYATPFPHVSYQVAEDYDLALLEPALEQFARKSAPFRVNTTGLGIFTAGPQPVLYIPIIRSPVLTEFHQALWQALSGAGSGLTGVYAPDTWVPHITIAFGDVHGDKLAEAVRLLSERDFNWEIAIDNVALGYDSGTQQGLRLRFGLGRG
jgi:2'-5' RNA ligase